MLAALTVTCWLLVVLAIYHEGLFDVVMRSFLAWNIRGALLILLAAQTLGWALGKVLHWRPDSWPEAVAFEQSAGLGMLSNIFLALAYLGSYSASTLHRFVVVVAMAGSLAFLYGRWRRSRVRAVSRATYGVDGHPGDVMWRWISALAVGLALCCALAPEIEPDALNYHLFLPRAWLQHKTPVDLVEDFYSLLPLTWELLYGAALERSPIAAKLLNFWCFPLTALAAYEMTRRYFRNASPWLSVALFTSIPIVIWEATTANVDLPLTLHATLAIYGCLRYFETRSWQWLFMTTLNLGLAMATKHLGLFVLASILPPFFVMVWRMERRLTPTLARCMVLCFGALLVPLPWYVRSWQASGNPVFPELFEVFGARPPERWDQEAERDLRKLMNEAGTPKTMIATVRLPWDLTMDPAYYKSFGPAFLATIPALLLVRRRRQTILFLSASVFLYGLFWAFPHSSRQARFLLPVTSVAAVLAAVAFQRISSLARYILGRHSCQLLLVVMILVLSLNLPFFYRYWIPEIPLSVVMGLETPTSFISRRVPSYPIWQYVNYNLPGNARVLTFSKGDKFLSERDLLMYYSTVARPAVFGAPPGQDRAALSALQRLHITHVLFDKRTLPQLSTVAAIATEKNIGRWFVPEFQTPRFMLCRLLPDASISDD